MKRILLSKSLGTFLLLLMFMMGYAQQGGAGENYTCDAAVPVCPDNNFGINIPNVLGSMVAETGPDYGCVRSQPRPMWFYMRVATTGTAIFDLTQYAEPDGQGQGLDVDFVLWGPFEDQHACNELTFEKIVDCSYDARPYEVIDFHTENANQNSGPDGPFYPGTVYAGEFYILLVTNYNSSGTAGYVNLIPRDEMTATFDCSILGPTYSFCDYDGDGQETVDLSDYISEINGGDDSIGVTFHSTSTGAYNYTDILSNVQILTLEEPLTVYARKEDFNTTQVEVVIMTFNLIPEPEMQEATLSYCDNDGDGLEIFDLTMADVQVDEDQEMILSYYTSQEDADNAENPIENPEYYQSGNAVVYVRGDAGDCYGSTTITLEVIEGIELTPIEDSKCDEDGDGVETFNLNDYSSIILGEHDGEIRYYLNESDAIAWNENYITDIDAYETGSVVLYAAVSTEGGCESTATLTLTVLESPQANDVETPYAYCDLYNDGTETIDLTVAFADVVESTEGLAATYYLNEADAIAGNDNFIANPSSYQLTGTLVVYIRVAIGDCFDVAMVTFVLTDGIPVTNATLYVCYSESGQGTFDLTEANISEVGTLTYHTSEADAMSGTNAISNPTSYTGNVPSTIYVKVVDGDCESIAEISLEYSAAPNIDIPSEFAICSGYSEIVDAGAGFSAYLWSTGETTQTIEVDELGSYWVEVTDAYGCAFRHTFTVIAGVSPIISNVEVGQNSFTVTAEGGTEPYQYSINGMVFQDSNVFANLNQGSYNLYVRGADGCISAVEIASVFAWPTLFTPNDDGINDTWRVPGLEVYPGSKIRIFDRYGKIVHEANVSSNVLWDGTDLSGNKVPTQDYWYILDVSDGRKYTGHVTVKNRTAKQQ